MKGYSVGVSNRDSIFSYFFLIFTNKKSVGVHNSSRNAKPTKAQLTKQATTPRCVVVVVVSVNLFFGRLALRLRTITISRYVSLLLYLLQIYKISIQINVRLFANGNKGEVYLVLSGFGGRSVFWGRIFHLRSKIHEPVNNFVLKWKKR